MSETPGSYIPPGFKMTTARFDHQNGGDWPGNRGIVIETDTGLESSRAFSSWLPGVYLADSGTVDVDDYRVPIAVFRKWLVEVLATVDAKKEIGQ